MKRQAFVSPARADAGAAYAAARRRFTRGDRIDMRDLAQRLEVSRSTLYLWVGKREELVAHILAQIAEDTWRIAERNAENTGMDRAFDVIRGFMTMSNTYPPLIAFVKREPELALRILLRQNSPVRSALRNGISQTIETNAPQHRAAVSDALIDAAAETGAALQWTPVMVGQEPDIERIVGVMSSLLAEDRSHADRASAPASTPTRQ